MALSGENGHAAQSIKLAVGRALVGIQQNFPVIPFGAQHRLALIDRIFVAGSYGDSDSHFSGAEMSLRDAFHHSLSRLSCSACGGHHLPAIVIFLVR
jgi:hypothetical protein